MRIELQHLTRPADAPPAETFTGPSWAYTFVAFTDTLRFGGEFGLSATFDGHIQKDEIPEQFMLVAEQALARYRHENATCIDERKWSWE